MRIRAGAVGLAMVSSILLPGLVEANAPEMAIRADLEGRPIRVAEISSHFCHDFAFPRIHCFATAPRFEAAVPLSAGAVTPAFGPSDYVTIYSEPTYGGSFMHLSQNYDTLFWIGWNDRVSSFKARNSASGRFWSDWYGTGLATNFCCNQTAPILSPSVDNTFTSVYRN